MSGPFPSGHKVLSTDINPILLGWVDFSWFATTLAYVSADAPTFVFSVNADVTAVLEPGMRVKLTQTTDKFFIVTAVGAYAAGVTPITVYGGTDYTLANAAITAGSFSTHKKPFGFNASPAKWTETLTDTAARSTASPTAGIWYNTGSLSLSVPIGVWRLLYLVGGYMPANVSGLHYVTLSTANNSESDVDLTATQFNAASDMQTRRVADKHVVVAAKTTYFLNQSVSSGTPTSIAFNLSGANKTIIRAVCAYL